MLNARYFTPVVTSSAKVGDLLQQEELWLLRVSGDRLLQLTGDGASTLHPIDGDYLLLLKKNDSIDVKFASPTDPSSETPRGHMQKSVVCFTDNGVRFVGNPGRQHAPVVFDLAGNEVNEEVRCTSFNWCGFVTLPGGSQIQIV